MRPIAALPLLLLALTTGCEERSHAAVTASGVTVNVPVGVECTIQLRRDALGMANPSGRSPRDGTDNVRLTGKLVACDADWLVLETGRAALYVPRHNVLLVDFNK